MTILSFFTTTLLVLLCVVSSASAHGLPTMCLTAESVESQCGPDHTCDVRDEVSSDIGVCQEFDTSFETCDKRKGNADCADGFACLIGEVDPNIGACLEDNSPKPKPAPVEDKDEGCSSTSGRAPVAPSVLLLFGFGVVFWRRRNG